VKNSTRRESLKPGVIITTPMAMFAYCQEKLTTAHLKFLFVSKLDVSAQREILKQRYEGYRTVTGTRSYHMVKPALNKLILKTFSSNETYVEFDFQNGDVLNLTLAEIEIGKFYAFLAADNYQVGMVVDVCDQEMELTFQIMKVQRRDFLLTWPDEDIILEVPLRDVFLTLPDPGTNDEKTYQYDSEIAKSVKNSFRLFKKKFKK